MARLLNLTPVRCTECSRTTTCTISGVLRGRCRQRNRPGAQNPLPMNLRPATPLCISCHVDVEEVGACSAHVRAEDLWARDRLGFDELGKCPAEYACSGGPATL